MKAGIRRVSSSFLVLAVTTFAWGPGSDAVAGPGPAQPWTWPLQPIPHVLRGFEPPSSPYGPGHRGVDLAGRLGQPVLAIGAGRIRFAGPVAGRGVVVVDHGALESTYQPVDALLPAGTAVAEGQPLGVLEVVGSHCLPQICLHLGVKRGERYLDPLTLLGPRPVRLLPLGRPAPPTGSRWAGAAWPAATNGGVHRPTHRWADRAPASVAASDDWLDAWARHTDLLVARSPP